MNDLISRQAAIDAIRGWVNKAFEDWGNAETEIRCFNAVYPLIMSLPSAQPEQQWIPCSERLPEDGDTVLVQFDDGDMEILTFPNIYKRLNRVAWLPLPEPYKERREE